MKPLISRSVKLDSIDEKYKKAAEIAQKHGEALYKAAQESDKKEEPKSDEKPKKDGPVEEGEVVS